MHVLLHVISACGVYQYIKHRQCVTFSLAYQDLNGQENV